MMSEPDMGCIYVVMGVSGSGKTTLGQALAEWLRCPFYDGDDFHPPENVARMSQGIPLGDADRWPWLDQLADLIEEHLQRGETAVLACSALKKKYRQRLSRGTKKVVFVYLKGSFDLIWQRMQQREDHYMKAEMLQSQFNALEEPDPRSAIVVNIDQEVALMLADIVSAAK